MDLLRRWFSIVKLLLRLVSRKIRSTLSQLGPLASAIRRIVLWFKSFPPGSKRSVKPDRRGAWRGGVEEPNGQDLVRKELDDAPSALPPMVTMNMEQPEIIPLVPQEPPQGSSVRSSESDERPDSGYAMMDSIDDLVAIATKVEYERYDRNVRHDKRSRDYSYVIPPFTTSFDRPDLPTSWQRFIHPEGIPYYLKEGNPISVLTEASIFDSEIQHRIEQIADAILEYVRNNGLIDKLPKETYLVLEIRKTKRCGYYFVDHGAESLFWLDPFDFTDLLSPVQIKHTDAHVGLAMRSHYWYHNELFPHVYELSMKHLRYLRDTLVYNIGDVATAARTSVICDTIESLNTWLELTEHILEEGQDKTQQLGPGATTFICRLTSNIYFDRYLNLYGEEGARLTSDQSIYTQSENSLLLKLFFSPLMMYGPESHFRKLRESIMDYMASKRAWEGSIEWIFNEWRDVALYAAVLLGANVGFLSIQSVDNDGLLHENRRSNAQRASYFSIFTSLGSMFFALLLLRHQRQTMNAESIISKKDRPFGLEALAVMFSLPYTLFMYSMVAFILSFLLIWFDTKDVYLISQSSVLCVVLLLLLTWSIAITYEDDPRHSELSLATFGAFTWVAGIMGPLVELARGMEKLKNNLFKGKEDGDSRRSSAV